MRPPYGGAPRPWERFERTIARYTLEHGPRDPAVEAMRFPSLIRAYREMCPTPEIAPTQRDYSAWVDHLVYGAIDPAAPQPDRAAVWGRAGRAYISLVEQHHAYLVLLDTFGAAAWDDDLDMRYGAIAVGLALRAPTPRSREAAERKARRYGALPFTVRSLEVEPHAYTAGPFWLYRPEVLAGVVIEALREHWREQARALCAAATAAYASGQRRPKASRRDFMDGVNAALLALRETQG
jgi:hypothetical protein